LRRSACGSQLRAINTDLHVDVHVFFREYSSLFLSFSKLGKHLCTQKASASYSLAFLVDIKTL
jgi:hypothetical protein